MIVKKIILFPYFYQGKITITLKSLYAYTGPFYDSSQLCHEYLEETRYSALNNLNQNMLGVNDKVNADEKKVVLTHAFS